MICPKCNSGTLFPLDFEKVRTKRGRYRTKCNICNTTITLNPDLSLYQKSRKLTEEERQRIISLKKQGLSYDKVSQETGIPYSYCYYTWQDFYRGGSRGHQ